MANQKIETFSPAYIVSISFISAFGGYLFGFDFAVISGALPFLRIAFGLGPWQEGFLTGSLALGCIVGCLLAGKIANQKGRRPGLLLSALIFGASSIGMACSPDLNFFLVMRFAAGIGVGMASMLSPMYIAEVSNAVNRGRNVSIYQLAIVIGILVTNLVNYFIASRNSDAWRWMFGLGCVPSILFLIGIIWLPESPRWLVKAGRTEEAKKTLLRIGGEKFATDTLLNIKNTFIKHDPKKSHGSLFKKDTRVPVVIGITMAVFIQFCGISVVFNYTSTIFESVGASLDHQLLETVAIGLVNLIFTVLAMWQVDKMGRKPLLLAGSIGLCVLYILIAFLLKALASILLISFFILLAIGLYAATLAPVFWVVISEIFPNKIRERASSMALVAMWTAYFTLVFTFPVLTSKLGIYGPFLLYAGICLAGFFFIRSKVPETKGRTLEEIGVGFRAH